MLYLCPYCHTRAVPAPPDNARPHAECENCHAKPRATISYTKTGKKLVRYVKDGRKPSLEPLVQRTVKIYARQAVKHAGNLSEAIRRALDAEDTP